MTYNEELSDHIIVGIHKGFNAKERKNGPEDLTNDENYNFGVTALQMIS